MKDAMNTVTCITPKPNSIHFIFKIIAFDENNKPNINDIINEIIP